MGERSRWVVRRMKCPEERGETRVLLEWGAEKGKKVLRSISCSNPILTHYSGEDCEWRCIERLSPVQEDKAKR